MGRTLSIALFTAGFVVTVLLISFVGHQAVYQGIAAVGIGGFALLCCYALLPLLLSAAAWSRLLPRFERAQLGHFVLARLIRVSAANLLLVSESNSVMLAVRAMITRRVLPAYAVASVAVDATAQMLGQMAFLALAVVLSLTRPDEAVDILLIEYIAPALILVAIAGILFLMIFDSPGRKFWRQLYRYAFQSIEIDDAFLGAKYELYASYGGFASSAALHLMAWIASGVGTYIALRLMGSAIRVQDAVALEAFVCAIRTLGAGVPAALGVQEVGYAVLVMLFSEPAEFGIAVSLLKRAREVVIGIPALLYWRMTESDGGVAKAR
jgi:putative membrane protein